jgi:hypothetical protein
MNHEVQMNSPGSPKGRREFGDHPRKKPSARAARRHAERAAKKLAPAAAEVQERLYGFAPPSTDPGTDGYDSPRPYFKIDGREISDSGGEVVYQSPPRGDAPEGTFHYSIVNGDGTSA